MDKIQHGKYVELGYDLYTIDADGTKTLVHQTSEQAPESIIFGVTPGVVEPLARAIEGQPSGYEFDVVARAAEAFGEHSSDDIVELDRSIFEVDGEFDDEMIKVGAAVPMMTADGYHITGVVLAVTADKVKMDFNHPLAGKDVRFRGRVYTVRDATAEELNPSCGCGSCGCGGGGCGDCGGGCC